AEIEPVLLKGRAMADLYPELALRPYGDVDLCFKTEQYATALAVLESPEGRAFNVDPHDDLDRLYGLSFDELLTRSQMMRVGKIEVRVPCSEDHLRILCIHFLKHGAWRPLSLCDVAAALESRSDDFDWDRCLGTDKLITDWVACTIGLAHKLLGARTEDTPVTPRASRLPRWLLPAVLKQWEKPYPQANETTELMMTHLRKRSGVMRAMGMRWPNPIRATVYFRAPFNELPRFPFQLSNYVSQAARFLAALPKALREQE
ncbi:MAG TPA: nucleotidyltransferase family protein, partial [Blastocatellia bacterium]|nr:nucleotidyltransferase family protein [Blastocatellia bacterium]